MADDFDLDFNPMAMMADLMAGQSQLHSAFLAPLPPSLAAQVKQFLADGSGPLAGLVDQFRRQGAPDPMAATRQVIAAAQGVLVVVIQLDHGVSTIPQFFFGHLDDQARRQAVLTMGEKFTHAQSLEIALEHLSRKLHGGAHQFPALIAGPEAGGDVHEYWLDLGAQAVVALDQGLGNFFGGDQRMKDLAWCVATALPRCLPGGQIEAEDLDLLVRCQMLAGDIVAAVHGLDALIQTGELDEESFITLLNATAEGSIAIESTVPGTLVGVSTWLAQRADAWAEATGVDYDLWRTLLRVQIGAGVGVELLLPTAEKLWAADRKTARQDLTREPLWQVLVAPAADAADGGVMDTAAAADFLGRSTTFVVKRLEGGTIPWYRGADESVRLPTATLAAWKAIMDQWKLLG